MCCQVSLVQYPALYIEDPCIESKIFTHLFCFFISLLSFVIAAFRMRIQRMFMDSEPKSADGSDYEILSPVDTKVVFFFFNADKLFIKP